MSTSRNGTLVASLIVVAVFAISAFLFGCSTNASTEPVPTYRGFEKYEGRWGLVDVREYEDTFRGLCDFVFETYDVTHPELIDRWGIGWIVINDLWSVAGYGALDPSHNDGDDVRDYIALQVDDAVIHQCQGALADWRELPETKRPLMDDPVFLPVPPFQGEY